MITKFNKHFHLYLGDSIKFYIYIFIIKGFIIYMYLGFAVLQTEWQLW